MAAKKQGLVKDGTRRRTPATKGGRGGGMPRIMWLAIIACAAGAFFLFRSQSADVPTGIGENQTFFCQRVQVGCGDSAVAVEDRGIAILYVIGENDHDVKSERLFRRGRNVFLRDHRRQHQRARQRE